MQGIPFDTPVPPGGYRWWYVDGFDREHTCAITVIAFVGSVFSPAYVRARHGKGPARPEDHCGINVVVHGPGVRAWVMTELPTAAVSRTPDTFVLGTSRLVYRDGGLDIDIDERTAPWGSRILGRVRVRPRVWHRHDLVLDPAGRHAWTAIAPCADVEVDLDRPGLRFAGPGYHDGNAGHEGLEDGLARWTWARTVGERGVAVLYDVHDRQGNESLRGLWFDDDGRVRAHEAPELRELPRTRWRLPRAQRVEAGAPLELVRTLVDAPFYARTVTRTELAGVPAYAMHEYVDLARFSARTTQWMLPFRIAGVGWW